MATAPKAKAAKPAEKVTGMVESAVETTTEAMEAAFAYPKFEVPELVRSFAEEGMKQTREAYARVKSALDNCGFHWPNRYLTINLSPADVKKEGSGFDLPIAVGILQATDHLDQIV